MARGVRGGGAKDRGREGGNYSGAQQNNTRGGGVKDRGREGGNFSGPQQKNTRGSGKQNTTKGVSSTSVTTPQKTENPKKEKEKVKEYKSRPKEVVRRPGKQGKPEKFNDLRYPYSTIESGQDFIKFSAFKYKRGEGIVTRNQDNLKSDLLGQILLPIPANLVDSNQTAYGEGNMNFLQEGGMKFGTEVMSGQMERAGGTINDLVGSVANNKNLIKNYFATQAMNSIGGNLSLDQILARSNGSVINPNMELLFKGPALRNFGFQFKFTPRFQKEAETVRTIIKAFKRNMAPKGSGGTFLKTPNIFEIQYEGKARNYLNRIKLCALTNVQMNYTGDGTWATYNDGSPISMNMTLAFRELTPVYNEDYEAYGDESDGVGY
tara:strand:- start:1559 stop:2692 length:1134 start_codon:yes stop_codon:yes gene_type:complete